MITTSLFYKEYKMFKYTNIFPPIAFKGKSLREETNLSNFVLSKCSKANA